MTNHSITVTEQNSHSLKMCKYGFAIPDFFASFMHRAPCPVTMYHNLQGVPCPFKAASHPISLYFISILAHLSIKVGFPELMQVKTSERSCLARNSHVL